MDAVRITDVSKTYGKHTAVSDLSLTVPQGALYGFIGPNGSGKTTTIRMILRIIQPDRGEIEVFGAASAQAANDALGYLPEERGLFKKMSVRRMLGYYASLKGMSSGDARQAIADWLERFDLSSWATKRIEALSKGMSQKVQFIACVVARPKLLILDEPFTGLDPVNTEVMRSAILDLQKQGTMIIFSTHDMSVAEKMCDFVFMLYRGEKVLDGTLHSVKSQYGADSVRLRVEDGGDQLNAIPEVKRVVDMGGYQEVQFEGDPQNLLRRLVSETAVQLFEVTQPSLHDIFIRIAGPSAEENGSSAVTSKGFIIGVLMMPVFMGGAFVVQYLTRDQEDLSDRKVAIVDHTGVLFSVIAAQADERNKTVFAPSNSNPRRQVWPKFIVEQYAPDAASSEHPGVVLSQRVKQQELFGFIIIDKDAILAGSGIEAALAYHTETLTYSALPNWLEQTVNTAVQRLRMKKLNIDPVALAAVTGRVPLRRFGLVEANEEGNVLDAREDKEHKILKYVVPLGGMMLMFMMVMAVAPAMLNTVLEEKIQKISEFLVSSVSPFQLMLGKLLGGVGVALTLSFIYLGAVYGLVRYFEFHDRVPPAIYLWFMLFLLLALTIFGSMFSAIGAACSDIRDAQGLMTPIVLMAIIPMLCLGPVLTSPSSMFSRLISLVPPATPMLMFVRIAIPPGPPVWEIVLGVGLTLAFAICCVWAAGKVFRIGILSQGQPPTMRQLFQWVFSSQ